jgi:hypothetical protein
VQRVCNSPAGTVQLELPDSMREMPTATEPAPAVVDVLKQRKRLPMDGDWVWARHGRGVEVCVSAPGKIIDRVSARDDDDVNLGVAACSRLFEHADWGRETPSERRRFAWKVGDLVLELADELLAMEAPDGCKPIAVACPADLALGGIVELVPAAGCCRRGRLSGTTTLPNGGRRLVQFAVSFCEGSVLLPTNWVVGPVQGCRIRSRRHGLEAIEGLNEARV